MTCAHSYEDALDNRYYHATKCPTCGAESWQSGRSDVLSPILKGRTAPMWNSEFPPKDAWEKIR